MNTKYRQSAVLEPPDGAEPWRCETAHSDMCGARGTPIGGHTEVAIFETSSKKKQARGSQSVHLATSPLVISVIEQVARENQTLKLTTNSSPVMSCKFGHATNLRTDHLATAATDAAAASVPTVAVADVREECEWSMQHWKP